MKRRSDSAFTLLEIIIAMVVFSIAVTSILGMFALAAASHRQGVEQARARMIARQVLAKVQAEDLGPRLPSDRIGVTHPGYGGAYSYDIRFRPVAVTADGVAQAYHVTITVILPGDAEEPATETFEAVLLRRVEP